MFTIRNGQTDFFREAMDKEMNRSCQSILNQAKIDKPISTINKQEFNFLSLVELKELINKPVFYLPTYEYLIVESVYNDKGDDRIKCWGIGGLHDIQLNHDGKCFVEDFYRRKPR